MELKDIQTSWSGGCDFKPKPFIMYSISNVNSDRPELLKSGNLILKGVRCFFCLLTNAVGDGWKGELEYGPYDAIHVGAAAESVYFLCKFLTE